MAPAAEGSDSNQRGLTRVRPQPLCACDWTGDLLITLCTLGCYPLMQEEVANMKMDFAFVFY